MNQQKMNQYQSNFIPIRLICKPVLRKNSNSNQQ